MNCTIEAGLPLVVAAPQVSEAAAAPMLFATLLASVTGDVALTSTEQELSAEHPAAEEAAPEQLTETCAAMLAPMLCQLLSAPPPVYIALPVPSPQPDAAAAVQEPCAGGATPVALPARTPPIARPAPVAATSPYQRPDQAAAAPEDTTLAAAATVTFHIGPSVRADSAQSFQIDAPPPGPITQLQQAPAAPNEPAPAAEASGAQRCTAEPNLAEQAQPSPSTQVSQLAKANERPREQASAAPERTLTPTAVPDATAVTTVERSAVHSVATPAAHVPSTSAANTAQQPDSPPHIQRVATELLKELQRAPVAKTFVFETSTDAGRMVITVQQRGSEVVMELRSPASEVREQINRSLHTLSAELSRSGFAVEVTPQRPAPFEQHDRGSRRPPWWGEPSRKKAGRMTTSWSIQEMEATS